MEDLYVIDHHKKIADNQRKRINQENKELEECTFKPDLSPTSSAVKVLRAKPKIALRANKAQHLKTQHTWNSQQ